MQFEVSIFLFIQRTEADKAGGFSHSPNECLLREMGQVPAERGIGAIGSKCKPPLDLLMI